MSPTDAVIFWINAQKRIRADSKISPRESDYYQALGDARKAERILAKADMQICPVCDGGSMAETCHTCKGEKVVKLPIDKTP